MGGRIAFEDLSQLSCADTSQRIQQLLALQKSIENGMRELMTLYAPDNGFRSPIIKVARNVCSDIERLAQSVDLTNVAALAVKLAQSVGYRSWMLSHHLGMHAWVRTLAVPGRGSPRF